MRLLRLATTLLITVVVVVSAVRVPALRALASAPTSARIAVQFVDEQTPEQLATFETTYGVMAVLPITDASLISFTAVDTDAVLTAVAGDPAVAAASRVTPLRRQSALSAGSNASLKLSTEGPDTFSAALVPRKTVAVGQVFPVSAIIETDGAATNSTTLDVFYDPAKFQLVNSSGVALANASAIPNTAPYKGGSGVLFNNWEVNSSSINTTTGRATLTLSTNLTPSDTEEDVFSSTDTAAPAGYHAGLDRLVTLYFKALVAVATPANDNIAILPNADTGSQAAQDEKIIRFADWASVPTSTCAAGGKPCVYVHAGAGNTVAVGDTRIVPSTASTCNSGTSVCAADSVVVAGDNDVGNTLAPGILANVGFTGAGASRVSGDPVYLNNDYPTGSTASVFGTITAGDTRLLPASGNVCSAGTAVCMIGSSVAAGDTDISSTLKHLNNVRQTDSGGSFTDLIANNAMQTAGVKITATAGTVSTSASSVSAAPSCVSSNGVAASTITVTARDSGNLPISGATVTLAKSPSSSSAVIGASTPATTNASGQVTFSVTDTVAETVTFTATINGTPVTQTAAVRWDSGTAVCAPDSSQTRTVSASPTCLVAGSATTVTVTARDAGNLPISGATVTLAKSPSSSSAVIGASTPATTNASGQVTFSVTDTVAETVTFTATINGTPVTQTAAVRWDSGTAVCTPDASQSRIDAAPNACVVTGFNTTITVALRNSNGTPLTNSETVTLVPSPNTSLTVSPANTVTTNTGTAIFTVSSSVAQSVTFTATATGPSGTVAIATPNNTLGNRVTFNTSCSGTTGSVISLSPACIVIPSSGSTTTSVVLTSTNNGSSSAFSNLSSSNSSLSLNPTSGNSGSTVSVTVPSSTSSGSATVTATVAGVSASTTLALIANGGSCTGGSQAHDDPLFKDQWWLANTGQSFFIGLAHFIVAATGVDQIFTTFHATAGADVRWTEARALNACAGGMCTGSGVTVAVVDSGVDASHPDLQGQVSPASQSFDPTQPSIDDTDGHGTFIAGLIAARAGNGAGIVGIAPQSQILAVKNELTTDSLSRSIRYAAEHGAAVINLSVGGSSPDAVERAAIDYATQAPYNAIVVASAGNDAFEGNPILYPASFPHVISVASIDPDGLQSLFSEVNSFVDVAAPGGLITSLMARSAVATDDCRTNASSYNMGSSARLVYVGPHDCIFGDGSANGALFTNESGTSFSAPMVAGAAALAKQKWPALTSDQFEQLVRATADDDASGNGYDPVYGAGTLNLARLLAFNFPPEIPSGSAAFTHPVVTTSGADTTQLLAKVNNMEGASDISTITADLSGLGLGSAVAMTDTGGLVYSSPVLTIPSTLPPNQYPVTVTARDAAGGQATAVVALQVSAVGDRLPAGGSPSAFAPAGLDVAVAITRPSTKKGRTTQKKSLPISGTIGADVAFVDVNGNAAEIDATAHTWGALVKLKDGKNRVVVTSYDLTRASSDEDSLTITKDAAGLVSASGSPSRLTSPLEKLRANGVVNSADRPNASVTRAEFAKMLVLTFGKTAQQGSLPADVPVSHSLAKFITTVVKLGWASGNNGRFSPDQPISRMEAARMLLRAAGWKASSEEFFSDLTGAEDRIATTLRTHGVVAGLNGRFEPFRQLTRSEAATILIAASTK